MRLSRTIVIAGFTLALVIVLSIVGSAFDDPPSAAERRCHELRVAANAVPRREDTVDDEVEQAALDRRAEIACAGVD